MTRKRSTFRARKPMKSANRAYHIWNKAHQQRHRAEQHAKAMKKPGAKVAASEIIGAAMCRRDRRNAVRAEVHARALANYHPIHAANAVASKPKRTRKPVAKKAEAA